MPIWQLYRNITKNKANGFIVWETSRMQKKREQQHLTMLGCRSKEENETAVERKEGREALGGGMQIRK